MSIKINMDPLLRQFTANNGKVEVKGKTIRECLDDLMIKYPDTRKWLFDSHGVLMILIVKKNGETIAQGALEKPVSDGDEISLVALIGGG